MLAKKEHKPLLNYGQLRFSMRLCAWVIAKLVVIIGQLILCCPCATYLFCWR